MALYCLCDSEMVKPISHRLPTVTMSASKHAMACIATGAEQYLRETDPKPGQLKTRRHYPNVDIFECPKCGTRIAKES